MLSREWRCSWSNANRRCSNYIWVRHNSGAYQVCLILEVWGYIWFQIWWKKSNAVNQPISQVFPYPYIFLCGHHQDKARIFLSSFPCLVFHILNFIMKLYMILSFLVHVTSWIINDISWKVIAREIFCIDFFLWGNQMGWNLWQIRSWGSHLPQMNTHQLPEGKQGNPFHAGFFISKSKFLKMYFAPYFNSDNVIRSQFCTCHERCRDMCKTLIWCN